MTSTDKAGDADARGAAELLEAAVAADDAAAAAAVELCGEEKAI